ncbi:tyrosine-type recombinase/integrase [Micromonospora aurantiaca (nom. illeg.)]|uniref:tyrosine-type recombinase/integrase n=1 Tax=Micromonospora aurantiaca (nom. illeg.) TaxID=47850 RepID=UPI0002D99AC4|nr:tyrosine-type recombinase/integrase [Micromonospora aurantiaca]
MFTRSDGNPINPNYATIRFRILVRRAGLPPVRLHDLRHGAASLAHEAGADLKTLQDLLGHSSIVVTADTYTSVLPQIQRRCADATAQLVLNAARRTRKKIKASARKNRPDRGPKASTPAPTKPKTSAPTPAKRKQAAKPQVTSRRTREKADFGPAPTSHPRDTHHPRRPDSKKGLTAIPAGQTLHDLVRPKGLEPLTF